MGNDDWCTETHGKNLRYLELSFNVGMQFATKSPGFRCSIKCELR